MQTYFIRHTERLSIEEASINALWDEHKIAIHYPQNIRNEILPNEHDNPSTNPLEYKTKSLAERAIKRLNEVATQGGYVCAEYRNHTGCLIGKVLPHSKITLIKARWQNGVKPDGTTALLKTLRLTDVQLLSTAKSALLLVARPQQGTLSRWHVIEDMVKNLVNRQPIVPTLDKLLPSQQEVLCAEFLRCEEITRVGLPQLAYLTTSIGHTMRDLDIMGISKDGKRIYAQVTYREPGDLASKGKLNRLAEFGKQADVVLLFFCKCEMVERDANGIWHVPLKLAFDTLKSDPNFLKALRVDFWAQT
jgi:hypothetical protein